VRALTDDDWRVRQAAAESLVRLGRVEREVMVRALLPAFSDPAFEELARHSSRPSYDVAFDALCAVAGEGEERV
jgi:HEAT repeat protein